MKWYFWPVRAPLSPSPGRCGENTTIESFHVNNKVNFVVSCRTNDTGLLLTGRRVQPRAKTDTELGRQAIDQLDTASSLHDPLPSPSHAAKCSHTDLVCISCLKCHISVPLTYMENMIQSGRRRSTICALSIRYLCGLALILRR